MCSGGLQRGGLRNTVAQHSLNEADRLKRLAQIVVRRGQEARPQQVRALGFCLRRPQLLSHRVPIDRILDGEHDVLAAAKACNPARGQG